ncbi:MAG: hypothetical protein ABH846_02740, partial [Patescibacteria group bacterium]
KRKDRVKNPKTRDFRKLLNLKRKTSTPEEYIQETLQYVSEEFRPEIKKRFEEFKRLKNKYTALLRRYGFEEYVEEQRVDEDYKLAA